MFKVPLKSILQATQSEGRPVDRARAWCSMVDVPFFRLSPQLSENIPLDCTDDRTLINMLWETQCYIYQHWERIQHLAILLKSWSVQDKIPKIKNPGACFSKVRSHYWSKVNFKKANKWVSIISITHSRKKRGNINDLTACQGVCLSFHRGRAGVTCDQNLWCTGTLPAHWTSLDRKPLPS